MKPNGISIHKWWMLMQLLRLHSHKLNRLKTHCWKHAFFSSFYSRMFFVCWSRRHRHWCIYSRYSHGFIKSSNEFYRNARQFYFTCFFFVLCISDWMHFLQKGKRRKTNKRWNNGLLSEMCLYFACFSPIMAWTCDWTDSFNLYSFLHALHRWDEKW